VSRAPRPTTGRADPAETGEILGERGIHDEWQSLYRQKQVEALQRLYLGEVVRRLGLKPGMKILDAGCGTAFNAVRLAEMGLEIDGIDISQSAIAGGNEYAAARGVADGVHLRQGDLTALDVPDGAYDAVLCLGVLMHVPDFDAAIGELARILKPGGALVLLEGNVRSPENFAQRAFWKQFRKTDIQVEERDGVACSWLPFEGGKFLVRNVSLPWLRRKLEAVGLQFE
jgi:ubiquinone/menaquinone biosynthesis C-methylase UbiE